jgi:capsule polysaccharide export protein KpsE/RkpR
VEALEKELAEVKASLASDAAGSEQAYQDLAAEFEALKIKATTCRRIYPLLSSLLHQGSGSDEFERDTPEGTA